MKTLLLTLLILVSLLTFGQYSYQIADTTKSWNTVFIGSEGWNVLQCDGTRTHKFQGEETANGLTFLKVFESQDALQQEWEFIGYLREDSTTKRVYFSTWNFNETGLLYDFDLQVGDSAVIDNYYVGFEGVIYICDSINTVTVNGLQKRRLYVHSTEYGSEVWVEGIGSFSGLLCSGYSGAGYGGGAPLLLCCSKDETVIYMDSIFNTCYIQDFYPKIASEAYDTAYLNTPYAFQVQLSDTINVDSFALIGDVIPEGFEFDATTGLLTGLPTSTGSFGCVLTVVNFDYGYLLSDILYSDITVVLPTVTNNFQNQPKIKIHPNPVDTEFSITFGDDFKNAYCLEIFNCEGKMVDKRNITEPTYSVDCSHFKKGIYLLKITELNQREYVIKKIVKK